MTQTTTLIAIAHNAGPFFVEWITYRRVIMSSPSEDGTETLLNALAGTRAVIYFPQVTQTGDASTGFHTQVYAATAEIKHLQSFTGVQADHKDTVAQFGNLIDVMYSAPPQDAATRALSNRATAKAVNIVHDPYHGPNQEHAIRGVTSFHLKVDTAAEIQKNAVKMQAQRTTCCTHLDACKLLQDVPLTA